MNIKTTLSATEARQDFFNILNKVEKTSIPFTITINGAPKVVIMNAEEYEGWLETMDIMSNPELVKGIEQGKKDLREGRYITLDEFMAKNKLTVVRDKSGEYTVVSTKKSRKRKK
ncbi:MAG: type II toxin-antitoxin system Phd/YefM family antitoxin [bacterium]